MSEPQDVVVLKFGSSVLRSEQDLPVVVNEIYQWWVQGKRVVAVVSAFGNTTDDLSELAYAVSHAPDDVLLAALLATGEATSSTLLGLALNSSGVPVTVLNAEQASLNTTGPVLDAELAGLDRLRLFDELRRGVVVLPGFVGRGIGGATTLLGRGGSDLTALFVSHQLGGHCRLVKDVDGLYTSDPNDQAIPAQRFAQVSYDTARRVGSCVVQIKAVDFAEKHRLTFSITSIGSDLVTEVGPCHDCIDIETVEELECVA